MNSYLRKISSYQDSTAVVYRSKRYSYNDLGEYCRNYSGLLAQNGVAPGDVVAILSDYSFFSIALFGALYENGNIIVPVTTVVEEEVAERMDEAFVSCIIRIDDAGVLDFEKVTVDRPLHPAICSLADKKHAGLILFSSGSVGKPKAMVHDLEALVNVHLERKSRVMPILVFLMFDHIGGLNTMLSSLAMGAVLVIPEHREPDYVCSLIEQFKVALLPASPTFLNLVLISEAHTRFDLSSLRMITYGTEPMPASLLKRLKTVFRRVKFLQTFGTSETGIAQTSSKSSSSTLLKIDDPNTQVRIEGGELWLRSKTQILGYLNASMESFTPDGWFKTGDIVEQTEDGFLRIIGRKKEMINVGGQKVLPSEVESVILDFDEVVDCMVWAKPNALTGQSVAAEVALAPGVDPQGIKTRLRKFCRQHLDAYKLPAYVKVVEKVGYGQRFKKIRRGQN